jgi:uncharacterized protein (TIGR02284 family)
MKNENTVEALNKLLEINNERLAGYESVLRETDEADIRSLFVQLARTSQKCREELVSELYSLEGKPVDDTKIKGNFFRASMDIKAALLLRNRKAILRSCEFSEENTLERYEKVLMDHLGDLSLSQVALINEQSALIRADHNKVRYLLYAMSRIPDNIDSRLSRAAI